MKLHYLYLGRPCCFLKPGNVGPKHNTSSLEPFRMADFTMHSIRTLNESADGEFTPEVPKGVNTLYMNETHRFPCIILLIKSIDVN